MSDLLSHVPYRSECNDRSTVVHTYVSGGVIALKAALMFDVTDPSKAANTVVECTAGGKFAGIALNATTAANQIVEAVAAGYVKNILVADTNPDIAAGDSLACATTGELTKWAGTELYGPVGIALETSTTALDAIIFPINITL